MRTVIIDLITMGVGTVVFLCSVFNQNVSEEGVLIGSSLSILGILIRIWKNDVKLP